MKALYETLEISNKATDTEIRAAYHKLALLWPPDKNLNDEQEATQRFQEISYAYETLKNPQQRPR